MGQSCLHKFILFAHVTIFLEAMDITFIVLGFIGALLLLPRIYSIFFGLKEGEQAPLSTPAIKKAVMENHATIVYFYTSSCPACKVMAPVINKVKKSTGATLVKVNARKEPAAAQEYKVMGVPATYIIKDGTIAKRFVGAVGEKDILGVI